MTIVRAVLESELPQVLDLIDEFDRKTSPRPSTKVLSATYSKLLESGGCVLGAIIDGSVVGTCTVAICPNFSWECRPYAVIENVVVTEQLRHKGIGRAILKQAVDFAKEQGCYKVALMTGSKRVETHRFYEASGFVGSKTGFQIRF
jgi:GNAT superfamily N-acetyltransferase